MNSEQKAPGVARPSLRHDLFVIIASGLAYFIAHGIGFLFPDEQSFIMLVWPAGGMALAVFLMSPRRLWPALTLTFFLLGIASDVLVGGRSFLAGVGFMAGNMTESVGCALLILRWSGELTNFSRLKEVLALIAGAVFINALTACIGAETSALTKGAPFLLAWKSWYISDGLGILLVCPFVVVWTADFRKSITRARWGEVAEFAACMAVLAGLAFATFYPGDLTTAVTIHPYILFAALLWPALRFGQKGVTLALMLLSIMAIISPSIAHGPSPWYGPLGDRATRLLELQRFIGSFAIVGYMMAASFVTLKQAEKELRVSQAFLNNVIDCSPNSLVITDGQGYAIRTNQALRSSLRLRDDEVLGKYSVLSDNVLEKHGFMPMVRDVFEKGIAAHFITPYDTSTVKSITVDCPASVILDVNISPVLDQYGMVKNAVIQHTDITERRRVEEELRRSEDRFRQLAENFPETIFEADLTGRVTYANPHGMDWFGVCSADIERGVNILQFVSPEDRELVQKRIVDRVLGKSKGFMEYRALKKDGVRFDAQVYSALMYDNGRVTGLSGFILDVSERKHNEAALRESEERFHKLFEESPIGIAFLDDQRQIFLTNQSYRDFLGYSAEEIRALGPRGVLHPDDWEPSMEESIRLRTGQIPVFHLEQRYRRKDGTTVWSDTHITPLRDSDGQIRHTIGWTQDITERKLAEKSLRASEERYRQLIETMTDGVYRSSHEGKFLEVNPAMVKILGYRNREELLAIDIKSDLYFAPGERESAALEEKLEEMAVFRLKKKDGSEVWVEDHGRHVVDEMGNILYHEGVLRDVTERMRAEEALRQAQKLNSIGTLAGGIAHDFNNVLGGIIGYADMSLRYAEKDSVLEKNLLKILKVSDRAKHLIQQILTFSRKASTHRSVISLRPVVDEVLELLKASIPSSVLIYADVSKKTKPVLADPTKIHEAVLNLATNAVHAMNRKGTLTVRLCEEILERKVYGQSGEIAPGAYSVIEVADTGCGMDPATLSKAFEPFFTTKGVGEGTGMGLSVVLGVVQSVGGDIVVETAPGAGTKFRLYLPVSKEPATTAVHDNDLIPFFGTEQILFVDDERMLVETARDLLAQLGYRVTGTSNSLEALGLLKNGGHEFDMLITDQTMPGLTGLELVKEVRALNVRIPVILCTGFSDDLTPDVVATLGISRIVMKPYRYNDVAKAIRDVIDGGTQA